MILNTIPFGTGDGMQTFCGIYYASTDTLVPRGTNTTLFNRHNEADQGNQHTNRSHNNIAVRSETIPGENNHKTTCLQL